MNLEEQLLDLDILLFALRSVSRTSEDISEMEEFINKTKDCIQNSIPRLKVYQNYFERNNIKTDTKNHYINLETSNCLTELKKRTRDILALLRPLNYSLPDILITGNIDFETTDDTDKDLQFQLRFYNWIVSVKNIPTDGKLLNELKQKEGFRDLNLSYPEGSLLGFLPYAIIVDEWKYKDLRLNKTLDTLLKEWHSKDLLEGLTIRNEFLTLKNGIVLVLKK